MKSQLQSNIIDRPIGGVQQSHGVVQPALQHILMQRHARVLDHQLVQVVGVVVQVRADLRVGNTADSVVVNVLDHLPNHIVVDIAQLLMPGQIDQKIFELHGVFFPKQNPFYLKFFDDFVDFRFQEFHVGVKKRLIQSRGIAEVHLRMGVFRLENGRCAGS